MFQSLIGSLTPIPSFFLETSDYEKKQKKVKKKQNLTWESTQ